MGLGDRWKSVAGAADRECHRACLLLSQRHVRGGRTGDARQRVFAAAVAAVEAAERRACQRPRG
eukprot:364973-Chlamydomonas_euryale.AAC.13